MTYRIFLKEQRAQLVVDNMDNGTKITSEPDSEGWVEVEVEIRFGADVLRLYHTGMEARVQLEKEWEESRKALKVA